MKNIFVIIIWALVLKGAVIGQWSVMHPETARNAHYFVVDVPDSDQFYAFGRDRLVVDTTSGDWDIQLANYPADLVLSNSLTNLTTPQPFAGVAFGSETVGCMVYQGQILRTTDAGQNWMSVLELNPNTQYSESAYFTDIDFPSPEVGYAVGTYEKIFKTTDGGATWQQLRWSNSSTPYRRLSDVSFRNDSVGFAVGYESDDILLNIGIYKTLLYRTIDGGTTWEVTDPLPAPGESDHTITRISDVGDGTLYMALINRNFVLAADLILVSKDDGDTWSVLPSPTNHPWITVVIRDMHWFNADEGLVLGSEKFLGRPNRLYATEDGGNTWQIVPLPEWPYTGTGLGYINSLALSFKGNHGLIVGGGGAVFTSEDRGRSWSVLRQPQPKLNAISMLDDQTGFAAGDDGMILAYRQGRWDTLSPYIDPLGGINSYKSLAVADPNRLALVGLNRSVYTSENGGVSWTAALVGNDTLALDLAYQSDTLFVLTRLADDNALVLLRRMGNGNEWMASTIDPQFELAAQRARIQLLADGTIIIGAEGRLYRSLDGGESWTDLGDGSFGNFGDAFYFTNVNTGFIGFGSQVWRTEDAGENWQFAVRFVDTLQFPAFSIAGFSELDNGDLIAIIQVYPNGPLRDAYLRSTDGGVSWTAYDIPIVQESLFPGSSGWSTVDNQFYLAAANGVILRYTMNTTPIEDRESLLAIPVKLFPNPVENALTVEHPFQRAIVTIYDQRGRELAVFPNVSGRQTLSLENLSVRGVLLVRVTSAGYAETIKVIRLQ